MSNLPITGVYNDAHIAQLHASYRQDPSSVDESWRQYFRFAESLSGAPLAPVTQVVTADGGEVSDAVLRKAAGAAALVDAIRCAPRSGSGCARPERWRSPPL